MTWVRDRYQIDPKHINFEKGVFTISREGYDEMVNSLDRTDIKYMGVPNVCFSLTDASDDREEKFAKQRLERGFDGSETWSLDGTIAKFTLPRLKVFRETVERIGCRPGNLSHKGWLRRLDLMIKAVELYADWKFPDKEHEPTMRRGSALLVRWYGALWW